ncbi:MAG: hypothetical protein ACTHMJ_17905 [Thermomicrobiales bacterium]
MVSGCAKLIAALLLAGFGFGLLLFAPVLGIGYFVLLGIIVLLRVLLR